MKRGQLAFLLLALGACARSGAESDRDCDASVETPADPSAGPVVLVDEAHHNIHTANGTYAPFANLVRPEMRP